MPLRRLRKVTQQLADGVLSARIGEGLVHRKDEVADLGRDVDRMSDRAVRLHGGSLRAFNAPGAALLMEMELPLAG